MGFFSFLTLGKIIVKKKIMGLKITIEDAARSALKSQEPELLSTLRMLLSAMRNREIEKRTKLAKGGIAGDLEKLSILTEEEEVEVLRSEAKKRREAVVEYEKGGRKDLAKKENAELKMLEKYLPQELADEEIEKIVREVIGQLGEVSQKPFDKAQGRDFGRVMGEVMKRIKGSASGDRVSGAVKKFLTQ